MQGTYYTWPIEINCNNIANSLHMMSKAALTYIHI